MARNAKEEHLPEKRHFRCLTKKEGGPVEGQSVSFLGGFESTLSTVGVILILIVSGKVEQSEKFNPFLNGGSGS